MKKYNLLIIGILAYCVTGLHAEEKSWTPDIDYNAVRHNSDGDPIKSPWDSSVETDRAEYQMLYLLQAHKDATLLRLALRVRLEDAVGDITQAQSNQLSSVGGNLSEVVISSYAAVTPHFSTKMNPSLLLMMLYHYEVYCYGGDSNESWPAIIKPLQDLDPAITAKAKELAKKGIEDLYKIKQ